MKPDSDETSGFKVDSFNPKCKFCLSGFMQPNWLHLELDESTSATLVVAFGIERVNFLTPLVSCNCNQAGCIWN